MRVYLHRDSAHRVGLPSPTPASQLAEKLLGKGKECQGTASQLAQKLIGKGKKCQGTAEAVPQGSQNQCRALQAAEKLIGAAISNAL
jgi:hypothetical protein